MMTEVGGFWWAFDGFWRIFDAFWCFLPTAFEGF